MLDPLRTNLKASRKMRIRKNQRKSQKLQRKDQSLQVLEISLRNKLNRMPRPTKVLMSSRRRLLRKFKSMKQSHLREKALRKAKKKAPSPTIPREVTHVVKGMLNIVNHAQSIILRKKLVQMKKTMALKTFRKRKSAVKEEEAEAALKEVPEVVAVDVEVSTEEVKVPLIITKTREVVSEISPSQLKLLPSSQSISPPQFRRNQQKTSQRVLQVNSKDGVTTSSEYSVR